MKCDICKKTEGVKAIIAGQEVADQETEDEFRLFIEDYTQSKIHEFPHLCPEHYSYALNAITSKRKSSKRS